MKTTAQSHEMLVEYNKIRLENGNPRKRVIGFDLSSADFTNWPLRDTGALHEKRKQIVADVTAELKAENSRRFSSAKPNESNCWKDSHDSTGEGPAPRRLADGEIVAPKDSLWANVPAAICSAIQRRKSSRNCRARFHLNFRCRIGSFHNTAAGHRLNTNGSCRKAAHATPIIER